MRLIDADELEKVMTEDWFLENLAAQDSKSAVKKDIVNMIDSVPLAYDVDAVVAELEQQRENIEKDYDKADDTLEIVSYGNMLNVSIKAIEIVKAGVKNDI